MNEREKEISNHDACDILLIDETRCSYKLGNFPLAVTTIRSFIASPFEIFVCFIEISLRISVSVLNDSTDKNKNRFRRFFEKKTGYFCTLNYFEIHVLNIRSEGSLSNLKFRCLV
jgi:hypothetical protein